MGRRRGENEPRDEHGAGQKGMQLWLSNQAILFDQMNEMSKRWLDRRREDIDAARQSLDEIGECESWSDMFRIQQEWFLGSLRRLGSDLSEFASGALSLSRQATARLQSNTQAMAEDVERTGRETIGNLSAAGSKPRTEIVD